MKRAGETAPTEPASPLGGSRPPGRAPPGAGTCVFGVAPAPSRSRSTRAAARTAAVRVSARSCAGAASNRTPAIDPDFKRSAYEPQPKPAGLFDRGARSSIPLKTNKEPVAQLLAHPTPPYPLTQPTPPIPCLPEAVSGRKRSLSNGAPSAIRIPPGARLSNTGNSLHRRELAAPPRNAPLGESPLRRPKNGLFPGAGAPLAPNALPQKDLLERPFFDRLAPMWARIGRDQRRPGACPGTIPALSARRLHSMHCVANGRACKRASGIWPPHSSQIPYVPLSICWIARSIWSSCTDSMPMISQRGSASWVSEAISSRSVRCFLSRLSSSTSSAWMWSFKARRFRSSHSRIRRSSSRGRRDREARPGLSGCPVRDAGGRAAARERDGLFGEVFRDSGRPRRRAGLEAGRTGFFPEAEGRAVLFVFFAEAPRAGAFDRRAGVFFAMTP